MTTKMNGKVGKELNKFKNSSLLLLLHPLLHELFQGKHQHVKMMLSSYQRHHLIRMTIPTVYALYSNF